MLAACGAQAINCEFDDDPEGTFDSTIEQFLQLVRTSCCYAGAISLAQAPCL